MRFMAAFVPSGRIDRRRLLLAAAAAAGCCAPFAARSATIYTPHEIAEQFERRVTRRLHLPANEARLYAGMAELQVMAGEHKLLAPQYLLLVDGSPDVQAALLMWRLAAGAYDLLGAAPASTGGPVRPNYFETPQGVFERANEDSLAALGPCDAASPPICRRDHARVLDFGWQRARKATGRGPLMPMRLQARAADARSERRLGTACSDGCILLPASLMHFLDELALLDAGRGTPPPAMSLPFRGRYLLVVDSGREERPYWSPAPAANG
jgi:hypothetical protein